MTTIDELMPDRIPRSRSFDPVTFEQMLKNRSEVTPRIYEGLLDDWPARVKWNPEYFRERFGDLQVLAIIDLPEKGSPFAVESAGHLQKMRLGEIVDRMLDPGAKPCYAYMRPIEAFPGEIENINFDAIVRNPHPDSSRNFWIGSEGTRSGLHFDRRDNFLTQFHGRKWVMAFPPGQSKYAYQFHRHIDKSWVDPDNIDFEKHPRFRNVRGFQATLEPGETLLIPRLWWHHVRSLEPSVSLNYFFGEYAPVREQIPQLVTAGIGAPIAAMWDCLWYGVMDRPYKKTLYTGAPSGAYYYRKYFGWRFKRVRRNGVGGPL